MILVINMMVIMMTIDRHYLIFLIVFVLRKNDQLQFSYT